MQFNRLVVVTLLIMLSSTISLASDNATKAYINGKVLTVDDQFSVAQAFIVSEGRFTHVGSTTAILDVIEEGQAVIDLEGRTVIPGLIDTHNHFIRGAEHWENLVRLDGIKSRKLALDVIRQKARTLAENEWLLVLGGWHEQQFTDDPSGFTLQELDEISPNNPAFIQAGYSHAFVNSAFYRYMDIPLTQTETLDLPPHPVFGPRLPTLVVRDKNGRVTSKIEGGIRMVIQAGLQMPTVPPDVAVSALKKAQTYFHALGLTAVYDPAGALITDSSYTALEKVYRNHELTLRTFRTKWMQPHDLASAQQALEFLESVGPFFAGDDIYDTIAVGEAIYLPIHDDMGKVPEITPETKQAVNSLLTTIIRRKLPVQIHAVNTATLSFYLDILEALSREYGIRPGQITFTHAEGANESIFLRLKKLGATLQIQSVAVVHSRAYLLEESGSDLLGQPQLQTINQSGVLWGLGTDGTKAGQINPMITLDWAVTGRAINGDLLLPEEQQLSREQALIAHTRNNAVLVGRGDSLGQIRPGYYADFVVLDADYMSVAENDIGSIKPTMTVVSGNVVYAN